MTGPFVERGQLLSGKLKFGEATIAVPVVLVDREDDQYWLSEATRVTVTVGHSDLNGLDLLADRVIDVRSERRRRAPQPGTVAATPGVARR